MESHPPVPSGRVFLLSALALASAGLLACTTSSSSPGAPSPDGGQPDGSPAADGGAGTETDPTPDQLASGGGCPAAAGAGTDHQGTILADETWTAAASPHRVTADVQVRAKLTIEPCAVVLLGAGYGLDVGSNTDTGSLIAHGVSQTKDGVLDLRPITFGAIDPAKKWGQIAVERKGTADLSVVAIQNGGDVTLGERGALLVYGNAGGTNDGDPLLSTTLDRVLIEKSATYGLNLAAWGGLTATSRKVWIRGSGSVDFPYPLHLEPGVAKTLPSDIVLTGNMKDEIFLATDKTFMRDDVFGDHGVPYHAVGALYVAPYADNTTATLTVDKGVTVSFESIGTGSGNSGMFIGSSQTRPGALIAVGTAASPIVFTSAKAQKAPGDWLSLYFKQTTPASHVSYARVEYAGAVGGTTGFGCGPSDNNGAVFIGGVGASSTAPAVFIDNTTFDQIGGSTVIVSGWIDDAGPNFTPTNTFGATTPGCHVSRPKRTGAGDVCDGGRTTCW
jgi:hypothetical protein